LTLRPKAECLNAGEALAFRPLTRADFPLLQRWLAAPHVAVWWNELFDAASVEAKYGLRVEGREPVHMHLMLVEGAPVGWLQWYRWRDFPEHARQVGADENAAGLDLAIGEIEWTGRGLGPELIRRFAAEEIASRGEITSIVADPSAGNYRSVRAFQKAGFAVAGGVKLAGEDFERSIVRLRLPPPA
jgi:aminoglycoside 6'-N-acetyltransferase